MIQGKLKMFGQNWIESLNMIFGTETTASAIIISFLILISITVLVIIAASKNRMLFQIIVVVDFLTAVTLTVFQWLPTFTGIVVAAIFALLGAWILTGGNQ